MTIYQPQGGTMNAPQHITLPIPGPEEFEDDGQYIPVPSSVVSAGIELLQCLLAQWKYEEGLAPDKRVWNALVVSCAEMLSSLMDAWAGEHDERDSEALIEQWQQAPAQDDDPGWEF
jgi:hypothetical protein